MTADRIRSDYIDFFVKRHGHAFVPSSPVVPLDDPTLLFTNAGMNQFKPIFLGTERRGYVRAANTQKCIRAGGKHNDLDDVGRSRRHHTFFEMLGNWSFGDYFKRGAIEMAWELLTQVWKMDASRLHVSCFQGDPAAGIPRDDEAADLWRQVAGLPDDHVHFFGADNFWEMGETGPCGPCSEIHIDRTPDGSGGRAVNGSDPRVMEIWNLVFIQYNRLPGGRLDPLPARHVDTGMGFERLCQVLQGKSDNYATDIWTPLFAAIERLSGARYGGRFPATDTGDDPAALVDPELQRDIAFRVIADHLRMSGFAIADGAAPSNKKRGAVLRSVIRRAVRYGYQVMNLKRPFLHELVPVLAQQMGGVFPELSESPGRIAETIRAEETEFLKTIDRGLGAFQAALEAARDRGSPISAEDIFSLHATLGFPSDLTAQLARQHGVEVDLAGYARLWEEHVEISGRGRRSTAQIAVDLGAFEPTDDTPKHDAVRCTARVLGWVHDDRAVAAGALDEDAPAALLLDRTCLYAEQGGQVGDRGVIRTPTGRFAVASTERRGPHVLHLGAVAEGRIEADQPAEVEVDPARRAIMRHHTTTHLLNWALRRVLGGHVEQKGSLVDAEKLRFDFAHDRLVTVEQIAEVERLVNEQVCDDRPVSATLVPLEQAKKIVGVRAVFGEKYPDPVRVVAIGADDPLGHTDESMSIEFCGGTHLRRTGEAGFFKILAEESVSKGVRRITAAAGAVAVRRVQEMESEARAVQEALAVPLAEAPRRVAALQEEIRQLKRRSSAAAPDPSAAADRLLADAARFGEARLIVGEVAGAGEEQLRAAMDSLKKRAPSHGILLGSADDAKASFVAAVSDDLIARGLKAGDWVREAAKVAGGSGGGRPQMAQAGGKDPSKLVEALDAARQHAMRIIG